MLPTKMISSCRHLFFAIESWFKFVENKKRGRMQREEGENAERRGRETERREREGRN